MVVKVRSHESVPFSRYFHFCNALRLWSVRPIPTYRVYRLYGSYLLPCTLSETLRSNVTYTSWPDSQIEVHKATLQSPPLVMQTVFTKTLISIFTKMYWQDCSGKHSQKLFAQLF